MAKLKILLHFSRREMFLTIEAVKGEIFVDLF